MNLRYNPDHNTKGESSSDNGSIPSAPGILYRLSDEFNKLKEFRKASALIALFCSFFSFSIAQSDSAHKKIYLATIVYTNGAFAKSLLYDVTDSALILHGLRDSQQLTLSYRFIEKIKIRRKGSVGTGILIGTGSGILVGTIVGAASYKAPEPNVWTYDPGQGGSAIAGGFLGAITGLISGVVIGSLPVKTIRINHSYQNFSGAIATIKSYCSKH